MPRLSRTLLSLALLLPACSQPRAATEEANDRVRVPDPPDPPEPAVSAPAGRETGAVIVRPALMIPGALSFPPSNWVHSDLVGYLELKGVKVEVRSGEAYTRPERQAVIFRAGSDTDDTLAVALVYRCKDARIARATAITMGQNAYSRGLFAFGPLSATPRTAQLLREIGSALSQPVLD